MESAHIKLNGSERDFLVLIIAENYVNLPYKIPIDGI